MRTNPVVRVLSLAIVLAILTLPALHAQFTTASLGGNVLDVTGAAVPGAKVAISNKDTGLKQETSSDAAGAFLFSTLPVGNYQLRVEKPGFATYIQDGISLGVGLTAHQTVTLKVGDLAERVEVSADAELVPTTTSTVGQLVNQRQIVDLPLDGRTAQSLVSLASIAWM